MHTDPAITTPTDVPHDRGHAAGSGHGHADIDDTRHGRRPWTVLAITLAAQVLVVLDISVVNTALPTIGADLHLDGGDLQWLVTAYLMMSGGGLLLGGRIADLLSRRTVFLVGLAVFTVASILSGFAGTAAQLTATRATQGLAAAFLTPSALSLIMTTYAGVQRRTGLAMWGAVGSLGVAAGVLAGGALTTWVNWQTIFWINGPIGAIALLVGLIALPKVTTPKASFRQFDLPGAATVVGGLVALVYALGATQRHGWVSPQVLVALAVSAVLFTAFGRIEARTSTPLVPAHTWKVKTLVSGTTLMLGATGILVGSVFLTSIYLQTVLGYSALRAGVAFLPFALAITAGNVVARHALGHAAPRALALVGLVVTAAGAVWLSTAGAGTPFATGVLPGLVVVGLGIGAVFVPASVTAMAGIPAHHAGMASGFLMTGHEVGAALGVAVLSAVAGTAGNLTSAGAAGTGFHRGLLAAAAISVLVGAVTYRRLPTSQVAGASGHMHH
jgi:EmrB/QacA subfamily drug resistance transporter